MVPNLRTIHIGRNIRRLRELRGMKQETLAQKLGVTQQAISHLEQSETIDEDKLQKVAEVLEINAEDIRNFREDLIFHNNVNDNGTVFNYIDQYQTNSLEKVIEIYERLIKEKDTLLQQKDEVIEMYKKQQMAS